MKRKISLFILCFVITICLVSCSKADSGVDGSYDYDGSYSDPIGSGSILRPSSEVISSKTESGIDYGETGRTDPEDPRENYQAGSLTCSVLDDIKNYNFFLSLMFENNQDNVAGEFYEYSKTFYTLGKVSVDKLVKVKVQAGEKVLSGVKVKLVNGDNTMYGAVTNNFGIAYLYIDKEYVGNTTELKVVTSYQDEVKETLLNEQKDIVIDYVEKQEEINNTIDLMFVVDTTGSMGDEISFLQVELNNVINRVRDACENVNIRLALLFYRDLSDANTYVTRKYDFTTDIEAQKAALKKEYADGGGDFPEAVDLALQTAVNDFSWSDQSTKLLIHVLDAPPHSTEDNIELFNNSIKDMAKKGITVIPVASSGINKTTEYLLRVEALMTGGKYVFLTDDSGYGNSHLPATTEEKLVVEYLNEALIRLIIEYHTGIESTAVPIIKEENKISE